jgi:hypothetical protein
VTKEPLESIFVPVTIAGEGVSLRQIVARSNKNFDWTDVRANIHYNTVNTIMRLLYKLSFTLSVIT